MSHLIIYSFQKPRIDSFRLLIRHCSLSSPPIQRHRLSQSVQLRKLKSQFQLHQLFFAERRIDCYEAGSFIISRLVIIGFQKQKPIAQCLQPVECFFSVIYDLAIIDSSCNFSLVFTIGEPIRVGSNGEELPLVKLKVAFIHSTDIQRQIYHRKQLFFHKKSEEFRLKKPKFGLVLIET